MNISLHRRHRWLGYPGLDLWRCTRKVPVLYDDPSAICPGCQVEVLWSEVPRVERYQNISNDRIAGEDLAVRLDLHLLERELERQPCGTCRTLEWEGVGSHA